MNKLIFVIVLLGITLTACSSVQKPDTSRVKTIPLSEFHTLSEENTRELYQEGFIMFIPKGTVVAVKINLQIPAAQFKAGNNVLTFTRDLYVYLSQRNMLLSLNKKDWGAVGDMDALKQIFDIESGALALNFQSKKGQKPELIFTLITY